MFKTGFSRLLNRMFRDVRPLRVIVMSTVFFSVFFFKWNSYIPSVTHSGHGDFPTIVVHSSGNNNITQIYDTRRRRLQAACQDYHGTGHTENILVYRNMSYGVVPKAGCTFWIRVFRFLHNDTNGRILDNPFQMSRTEAHGGNRTIKMYRLKNQQDRKVVMATTRFMVTRNPFTRLFSAYIDKLFLPDLWHSAGRTIASHRKNASDLSRKCGHDVTFNEFLSYIADVGEVNPVSLNGHWRPIEHTCNPCIFQPDIVATQETFTQDSQYIMKKFGLHHLLQNQSHTEHVLDEMTILTDWNFGSGGKCLNRKQLAWRIWHTFTLNGYLIPGSASALEYESEASLTKDRLKYLVTKSFISSPLSREDSRKQRNYYLRQAYSRVSRSVLDRIVRIYQNDFVYFGYKSSIDDLLLT